MAVGQGIRHRDDFLDLSKGKPVQINPGSGEDDVVTQPGPKASRVRAGTGRTPVLKQARWPPASALEPS